MGSYTAAHADPQGAGDARQTALQVIKDEGLQGKLTGKVIVITGATSGIVSTFQHIYMHNVADVTWGLETARALSATGATLFLTSRDPEDITPAVRNLLEPGRVFLVKMDNNLFASVREAAKTILTATNNKVNILICNAGLTEDGHEVHFQTNYLSHFLLFQLLDPALLSSATSNFHSRVVVVSSSAHRAATLPASNNYRFEHSQYTHEQAYAISKLAEIYLANTNDRKYGKKGLHATSLHPGAVATNISRNLDPAALEQIVSNSYVRKILKSPEQGAATTVVAAVGKNWEVRGGKYLEDCEEAKRGEDDGQAFGIGWVKQTYDVVEEERLWRVSVGMVGMGDGK